MTEQLLDKPPCINCNDLCDGSNSCQRYAVWEYECKCKLEKYETAEQEGKLLILPCKTVWSILNLGTPYAMVMSKDIQDLTIHEIKKINLDGINFSTFEAAAKKLAEYTS